jgi:Tfp pilus assembly protein PilF
MYDVFIIVVLPLLWILLNLSSFIIILLHELSHAIPALIFSKQDVTIYIGTYGDKKGIHFSIGKLTIYIRPKFSYLKSGGLCTYKANMNFQKRLIILLSGPVVTAIIASLLFEFVFFSDAHGFIRALILVLFVTALISLMVNLFPNKFPVKNSDRLYYSDGYNIILLFENRNNFNNITIAWKFYDEQDYANALKLLLKTEDKYMDESVFGLILSCYVQLKEYSTVKVFNKMQVQKRWYEALRSVDYFHLAAADMGLKDYNEALINLNQAIKLDSNGANSIDCFNNRGFVHNMLGNYDMAKVDLNKAIFLDELSINPYCNRAFTNLKLGRPGEAVIDIEKHDHSMKIMLAYTLPWVYICSKKVILL